MRPLRTVPTPPLRRAPDLTRIRPSIRAIVLPIGWAATSCAVFLTISAYLGVAP